jgi:DNA-binding SARP family transcriptional activator
MGAGSNGGEPARPTLRFGILGPLMVHLDGRPLPLGPLKQQQVLGMLLCRANSVTSVDTLTDTLWGEEPPRTARKNLQVYVACLRKLLGSDGLDDRLVHRNGGYLLRVGADELDLLDFQQRVSAAREAADLAGLVAGLTVALGIWRGGLLDGLTGTRSIGDEAERLWARYLAVFEDWAEGELALGNARKVVERIRELAACHPFRERLRQLEMTALHRAGRQTEALSVFDELRQSLARELGLRPSPATEKLYRAMLGSEPTARVTRPPDRPPLVLPPDVADFTGRVDELDRIEQLLADGRSRIVLITGAVGIGKTSLAVHASGLAGQRFPNGRMFVNARTEQGAPRSSRSVLTELLRFAGQPAEEYDGEELAGRWQRWLMDRQVLLAIDDVCDSAVLRAVLPLSGTSAVLATTRRQLDSLEYADRVELAPLEPGEAVLLLSRIIGAARAMADPSAVERIVLTVGLSPLAVRTVGAKLNVLMHLPLAEFAARLQDPDELLNEMSTRQSSLRSRLAAGLSDLREVEWSALQRLGSIPTPWFTQEQAAAVLSEVPRVAQRLLDSLVEANALTAPTGEVTAHSAVYEVPRLLRCYLRELATV